MASVVRQQLKKGAIPGEEDEIWALCKELEELGGGIRTRLETINQLKIKRIEPDQEQDGLPPFHLEINGQDRQLQVEDIYLFIQNNLTKFATLALNSTMITFGQRGAGKSTFLFQTSFLEMLFHQLQEQVSFQKVFMEAYEIGIDASKHVEQRTNLISDSALVNKTIQFIELGLTEGGRIDPGQLSYLVDLSKLHSQNFNQKHGTLNNKAHYFLKLHLINEDGRASTLTIVDMAGFPDMTTNSPSTTYSQNTEINNSVNYLLYLFKDMLFHEAKQNQFSTPKLNKSSKILKELSNLITGGNSKVSFLNVLPADMDQEKYTGYVDKISTMVRLPLIRNEKSPKINNSVTFDRVRDAHEKLESQKVLATQKSNQRPRSRSQERGKLQVKVSVQPMVEEHQSPDISMSQVDQENTDQNIRPDMMRSSIISEGTEQHFFSRATDFVNLHSKQFGSSIPETLSSIPKEPTRLATEVTATNDVENRKRKLKDEINNCMRLMNEEDVGAQTQSQLSASISTIPVSMTRVLHNVALEPVIDLPSTLSNLESQVEHLMVDADNVLFKFTKSNGDTQDLNNLEMQLNLIQRDLKQVAHQVEEIGVKTLGARSSFEYTSRVEKMHNQVEGVLESIKDLQDAQQQKLTSMIAPLIDKTQIVNYSRARADSSSATRQQPSKSKSLTRTISSEKPSSYSQARNLTISSSKEKSTWPKAARVCATDVVNK